VAPGAAVLAGAGIDLPDSAAAVIAPLETPVSAADAGVAPVSVPAADGVTESEVWVPAGDHRVPGTLTLPGQPSAAPLPVVLLLHGDLSSRNENGDLFTRQAAELAARGAASLRIDFAGSGDSEEADLQLDYPGMVADATASVSYLRSDPLLDPTRVAVLGLSRGGSIAATLAGTLPGVAALVEWSGAVYNGYDEAPDLHDQARADGYVTLGSDPGGFRLSLSWFDTIEQSRTLDDVAGYTGPVLAVTGSADEVVPPEVSDVLIQTVDSTDTTRHVVEDADHEFDATSDDQSHAEEALGVTTDWLVAKIGATSPRS
jgi:dipeptidyl aminopeptidase/acylaminoacyl peptidase